MFPDVWLVRLGLHKIPQMSMTVANWTEPQGHAKRSLRPDTS